MKKIISLYGMFLLCILFACGYSHNEKQFSDKEVKFIRKLGILDSNETILLFNSQAVLGGYIASGNFITERRIAAYAQNFDDEMETYSAFYPDIDTMILTPGVDSTSTTAYLSVYKSDSTEFQVYITVNKKRTDEFYKKAMETWLKNRKNSSSN